MNCPLNSLHDLECHRYLKLIVIFDAIPAGMLPAEDLATLHLDYAACERGFYQQG